MSYTPSQHWYRTRTCRTQATQREAAEQYGSQLSDLQSQLRAASERETQLAERLAKVEAEAADTRVRVVGVVLMGVTMKQ